MVDKEELDIVSVTTHVEHHSKIVIDLANAGVKAIFCEKGLAPSLYEANQMAEACERNGTILNLGAQRRYHPGFSKMKEITIVGVGPSFDLNDLKKMLWSRKVCQIWKSWHGLVVKL